LRPALNAVGCPAQRGIGFDHVTIYRWAQRFTPLLIDAARPCRHVPGDRWFVDETSVKVWGAMGLYRAINQYGQVIDVLVSPGSDGHRRFSSAPSSTAHGPLR
jgi:IS6 family transposase